MGNLFLFALTIIYHKWSVTCATPINGTPLLETRKDVFIASWVMCI